MKKLFLILVLICPIVFIGCLEPSQEKLDSNWVKSVGGKTFASPDATDFIIFDDAGNISVGNKNEDASATEEILGGLLLNLVTMEFFRSPDKNKAVYKMEFLWVAGYMGLSTDGKNLYSHEATEIPDDIDWEVYDEESEVYSLYKTK